MISQVRKSFRGNSDHAEPSILEQFKMTTEPRSSDLLINRDDSKSHGNTHSSMIAYQRPRQSTSFKKGLQMNRDTSPATSGVTSLAEEYYKQMQTSLVGENTNLKDHNSYLVSQIKVLFERQKKYKKALLLSRQKIAKLQNLNQHLNKQLQVLTSSIVAEIQRMQKLIEMDMSHVEDEMRASGTSEVPKSLEGIGWETESTLNNNLEQLKQRVHSIYHSNFGQLQIGFPNDCNFQEYKINVDKPKRESRRESNISNATMKQFLVKEDQFKNYLPINSLIQQKKDGIRTAQKKR